MGSGVPAAPARLPRAGRGRSFALRVSGLVPKARPARWEMEGAERPGRRTRPCCRHGAGRGTPARTPARM